MSQLFGIKFCLRNLYIKKQRNIQKICGNKFRYGKKYRRQKNKIICFVFD